MSEHKEVVDKARIAIDDVFSDTSVSLDNTRVSLEELRDEIAIHLESLAESA